MSYKIVIPGQDSYRSFRTMREAVLYRSTVYRHIQEAKIEAVEQQPNSMFINNRALDKKWMSYV